MREDDITMTNFIPMTDVTAMRSAMVAALAVDIGHPYSYPDIERAQSLLAQRAMMHGFCGTVDSWTIRRNQDYAQRMRRAVPLEKRAHALAYRLSRAERARINTALWQLSYGRRTVTSAILPAVAAMHGLFAWLTTDMLLVDDSGQLNLPLYDRSLVLRWYCGALEYAYIS
jgi:hypothetical protein